MPACPSNKGVMFSVNETRTAAVEQVTLVVHGLKIPVADTQTPLSHAEMLRLYRSANVYVSPFRSEGFGLGTLEAMALGLQACYWSIIESAHLAPAHLQMQDVWILLVLFELLSQQKL